MFKWYKAHQATIFFITGIFLPPVRLGHADTKTNLQSEKAVGRLKIHGFFSIKRLWRKNPQPFLLSITVYAGFR
jgi:hypothetical protein